MPVALQQPPGNTRSRGAARVLPLDARRLLPEAVPTRCDAAGIFLLRKLLPLLFLSAALSRAAPDGLSNKNTTDRQGSPPFAALAPRGHGANLSPRLQGQSSKPQAKGSL